MEEKGQLIKNRLCVKGRFGFDYVHNPERITKPLIRKDKSKGSKKLDPLNPTISFQRSLLG